MSPKLLTFACGVRTCPMELACPAAGFPGVRRNRLDGAESSSSVPESTHMLSLISVTDQYKTFA